MEKIDVEKFYCGDIVQVIGGFYDKREGYVRRYDPDTDMYEVVLEILEIDDKDEFFVKDTVVDFFFPKNLELRVSYI